ncbi:MAG: hypothetical protein KGH72_05155 [Candidatus Micrarchaeota archaeon]|nr:hypothetical protein [Candidatus Micrarchaeota archaeon]
MLYLTGIAAAAVNSTVASSTQTTSTTLSTTTAGPARNYSTTMLPTSSTTTAPVNYTSTITNETTTIPAGPRLYRYNLSGIGGVLYINMSRYTILDLNLTSPGIYVMLNTTYNSTFPLVFSFRIPPDVNAPSGYESLLIENITVSSNHSIDLMAMFHYACSDQHVRPYQLINGTWKAISNYTNDQNSCLLSFKIPGDPIIGIFARAANTTSTTTQPAITSATMQSTIPQATTSTSPAQPSNQGQGPTYLLLAVAILLVSIILYLLTRHRRKPITSFPEHHMSQVREAYASPPGSSADSGEQPPLDAGNNG